MASIELQQKCGFDYLFLHKKKHDLRKIQPYTLPTGDVGINAIYQSHWEQHFSGKLYDDKEFSCIWRSKNEEETEDTKTQKEASFTFSNVQDGKVN